MHLNPAQAGLVERATDWPWSFARWYLEHRSVGLPIRWPSGMERDDQFSPDASSAPTMIRPVPAAPWKVRFLLCRSRESPTP
jgi:hypothetical protein